MQGNSARLRPARWPLPQSILFMGSAITWGLIVVLATAMPIDSRLRPLDSEATRIVLSDFFRLIDTCPVPEPLLALLAALGAAVVAVLLRRGAAGAKRHSLQNTMLFLHIATVTLMAYFLTGVAVNSMNPITSGPPNYSVLLFYGLTYVLFQLTPSILALVTGFAILGRQLRRYWSASGEALQVALIVMGTAVLHAEFLFLLGRALWEEQIWL